MSWPTSILVQLALLVAAVAGIGLAILLGVSILRWVPLVKPHPEPVTP